MLALTKINDGNLERSEWLGGAHLDEGNFLLAGHRITIAGGKAFVANRKRLAVPPRGFLQAYFRLPIEVAQLRL